MFSLEIQNESSSLESGGSTASDSVNVFSEMCAIVLSVVFNAIVHYNCNSFRRLAVVFIFDMFLLC